MKIIMSNGKIYELVNKLLKEFNSFESGIELPIRVNYAIQYNLTKLTELYMDIEKARNTVGQKYGYFLEEENSYKIKKENLEKAQQELDMLLEIQHTVNIVTIKLEDLGEIKMTPQQMASIIFMIEREE